MRKISTNSDISQRQLAQELGFSLGKINYCIYELKKKGFLIIEDIPFKTIPIWEVVIDILDKKYESHLIKTKKSLVFTVQKK